MVAKTAVFVMTVLCLVMAGDSLETRDYRFILQDEPTRLFTMQQVTQNYLSTYGLLSRTMAKTVKNGKAADLLLFGTSAFFFMPMTHEEGHRAILTAQDIGSVSQPYFNSKGFAYVKGVSDSSLRTLRDTDLPLYIRLHTAGLESDYLLTRRTETMVAFGFDDFSFYRWEYFLRKLAILQYYVAGLLKTEVDDPEEIEERDRDIVGFDTYGAVRHLCRPDMEFQRYTSYSQLTREERKLVKRGGYRSLLNVLNPVLIGRERFRLNDNISLNAGAGYTMAPFGDFIDETVWMTIRSKYHCMAYLRQFQNEKEWFPAFGVGLQRYRPVEHLSIDAAGHFWRQPEELSFRTKEAFSGGAFDIDLSWFFIYAGDDGVKRGLSADLGFLYKTDGFLPEVMSLGEEFVFRIGTTLRI